jgi:hypothetical protein
VSLVPFRLFELQQQRLCDPSKWDPWPSSRHSFRMMHPERAQHVLDLIQRQFPKLTWRLEPVIEEHSDHPVLGANCRMENYCRHCGTLLGHYFTTSVAVIGEYAAVEHGVHVKLNSQCTPCYWADYFNNLDERLEKLGVTVFA